jgi:hypothetical protein
MPPILNQEKLARLAELADGIDGARPGQWEDDLAEFNRIAGTNIPFEHFQGIYGGEKHEDWVRRLLYSQAVASVADLSRGEMIEIVARAMDSNNYPERDFYVELFAVNCKHPSGTDLMFWPNLVAELPKGREPTVEEIADLAMRGSLT